jgi:hypothetical protein
LVKSAGGKYCNDAVPGQPRRISVQGLSPADAASALDVATDVHNRTLKVVEGAPRNLAGLCREAGSIFEGWRTITLGLDGDIQRFDPHLGCWKSTTENNIPGAYRFSYAGTTYAYRSPSGQAFSASHELVKLAAARLAGVRLHAYAEEDQVFISRLGSEPPGLLGRALVACSGLLPTIAEWTSRFTAVTPDVAASILTSLYTGDLPS